LLGLLGNDDQSNKNSELISLKIIYIDSVKLKSQPLGQTRFQDIA